MSRLKGRQLDKQLHANARLMLLERDTDNYQDHVIANLQTFLKEQFDKGNEIDHILHSIQNLETRQYLIELAESLGDNVHFVTITTRYPNSAPTIKNSIEHVLNVVNADLYKRRWRKPNAPSLNGVVIWEEHSSCGNLVEAHFHCILATPEGSVPITEERLMAAIQRALKKTMGSRGRQIFDYVHIAEKYRKQPERTKVLANYTTKNILKPEIATGHDQWGAGFYIIQKDGLFKINTTPRKYWMLAAK